MMPLVSSRIHRLANRRIGWIARHFNLEGRRPVQIRSLRHHTIRLFAGGAVRVHRLNGMRGSRRSRHGVDVDERQQQAMRAQRRKGLMPEGMSGLLPRSCSTNRWSGCRAHLRVRRLFIAGGATRRLHPGGRRPATTSLILSSKNDFIPSNRDQNHETHSHYRSPGAAGFRFRRLGGCPGRRGAGRLRLLRRHRGLRRSLHLLLIS